MRTPLGWYLAVARRPLGRNFHGFAYGLKCLYYLSPLHRMAIGGRVPDGLGFAPIDPWPGNAERGRAIMAGHFGFAGHSVAMGRGGTPHQDLAFGGGAQLWDASGAGQDWRAGLHGFGWLRDLRVAGGDGARATTRALITDWIAHSGRWRRLAWRPDILAARITAWIFSADFICQNAGDDFSSLFMKSLTRQARHLLGAGAGGLTGARRLAMLKGQIFASVALFGGRGRVRILQRFEKALAGQVLPDGGHVERSPSQQLAVLRDLVDIRELLMEAGFEVPHGIQIAIDRMAPMLRFFRHGDGGLVLFNDSGEEEAWLIDMALTRANAPGKPLTSAPHSGFERIHAGRTMIIADVGTPPPPGARDHTFAGSLAFEMSVGKERMVVNCGGGPGLDAAWRQGLRATAAHSTLTLAETNSTEIFEAPGRGSEIGKHPSHVARNRVASDGAVWLTGHHDGYVRGFGLTHERRLWLADNGEDLRGEDALLPPGAASATLMDRENDGRKSAIWRWRRGRPRVFHLRFHLHPRIVASLVQDGAAVLLRLPSGAGWRFQAEGGNVSVQDSIYVGGGEVKRSSQIVVSGGVTAGGPRPGALVRWAFRREKDQR